MRQLQHGKKGPNIEQLSARIGMLAEKALLYEAAITPKPGLVDRANSGAHKDMDLFTFFDSACSLRGYFSGCVQIGYSNKSRPPEAVFPMLRQAGLLAEQEMFVHTNGVNTHKGAIFLFGLICGAVGICWSEEKNISALMDRVAALAKQSLPDLYRMSAPDACTGGERQFFQYGLTGARGEAASGFRSVISVSLPAFQSALRDGRCVNDAGLAALAALMLNVDDSNVLRRGGQKALLQMRQAVLSIQTNGLTKEALCRLDEELIRANISPGGCADLLAVTLFLHFLITDKNI